MPILAREILRNDRHRPLVIGVGPGKIAAGNDARAHRCKEARRDMDESPYRRNLALFINVVLRIEQIVRVISVHRDRAREADRRDARHGREFVENVLLHMDDPLALRVRYLRLWNHKAKCLHRSRVNKAGRDMHQRDKGADHQPRADQQHQRQRNLHHHQRLARTVPFTALALRTPSLAKVAFTPVPA